MATSTTPIYTSLTGAIPEERRYVKPGPAATRRSAPALGFKLRTQNILLRLFVTHAKGLGHEFVRAGRVTDWAAQAPSAAQRRNRLLTVRRFALALRAEDDRHGVPTGGTFGVLEPQRQRPSIYASEEISRLLIKAARFGSAASAKPSTYVKLLGLLAATGMRVSEALALQVVDITADGLLVRATNFQKGRCYLCIL